MTHIVQLLSALHYTSEVSLTIFPRISSTVQPVWIENGGLACVTHSPLFHYTASSRKCCKLGHKRSLLQAIFIMRFDVSKICLLYTSNDAHGTVIKICVVR